MEQTARLYQADIAIDEEPFEENYFAEIAAGNVAITPQAVWYRGFGIDPNATDETGGLGQWRTALLPSAGEGSLLTANLGGAAIASTTYTEHPEEVKNFMVMAMATMEGAEAGGDWGIQPPYLPYLESETWTSVRDEALANSRSIGLDASGRAVSRHLVQAAGLPRSDDDHRRGHRSAARWFDRDPRRSQGAGRPGARDQLAVPVNPLGRERGNASPSACARPFRGQFHNSGEHADELDPHAIDGPLRLGAQPVAGAQTCSEGALAGLPFHLAVLHSLRHLLRVSHLSGRFSSVFRNGMASRLRPGSDSTTTGSCCETRSRGRCSSTPSDFSF